MAGAAGVILSSWLPVPAAAAPVINEIMYRPGTAFPENTGLEFIEIHNPDAVPVNVGGWALTSGTSLVFPPGTTIAAGGYHSCAVTTKSAVKFWGFNAYGQLGNGTTVTSYKPVKVVGLN